MSYNHSISLTYAKKGGDEAYRRSRQYKGTQQEAAPAEEVVSQRDGSDGREHEDAELRLCRVEVEVIDVRDSHLCGFYTRLVVE